MQGGPLASPATAALCLALLGWSAVVGNAYGAPGVSQPAQCPTSKRFRSPLEASAAPRVLFHSYMGSGNTWLRLMLENVTGRWGVVKGRAWGGGGG